MEIKQRFARNNITFDKETSLNIADASLRNELVRIVFFFERLKFMYIYNKFVSALYCCEQFGTIRR